MSILERMIPVVETGKASAQKVAGLIKKSAKGSWRALSTLGVCFFAGVMVFSVGQLSNRIEVRADGEVREVVTLREDPRTILEMEQISVGEYDQIISTYSDGQLSALELKRAFPVNVMADGTTTTVMMLYGDTQKAIQTAGLTLDPLDVVEPARDAPVSADLNIIVGRVEIQETIAEQPIPYSTIKVASSLFKPGVTKVVSKGIKGVKKITTTKKYLNGELVDTQVTEDVIQKPVAARVLVGTSFVQAMSPLKFEGVELSDKGIPLNYKKLITGKATAYGPQDGHTTSTGAGAQVGYVAVDPDVIPYGSKLYIRTPDNKIIYGCAIAKDTGGAARSGRIVVDLYMTTMAEQTQFGRRTVEVYILE